MTCIKCLFLILLFGSTIKTIQAEETDQFTLPPGELLDIGPVVSGTLYDVLEQLITQTNSEIQALIPQAKKSKYAASQLTNRLKETHLVDSFYNKTAPGFPHWLRSTWSYLQQQQQVIFFKENRPWKTVYWLALTQFPISQIFLSPTINMYGYYFGTDKLNHFFMQGHSYYKIYNYYLKHGKSMQQAQKAIIIYGQVTEHSYLGTMVNGAYSNGDLSANYAGWKFYRNFVHHVKIGKQNLPPIFVLNGYKWEFSRHIQRDILLKPYLSDNLNEALNPSHFAFMAQQIRSSVKKRCPDWIERKHITEQMIVAKLKEIKSWHGENYGHWLPAKEAITLNACFGGN